VSLFTVLNLDNLSCSPTWPQLVAAWPSPASKREQWILLLQRKQVTPLQQRLLAAMLLTTSC